MEEKNGILITFMTTALLLLVLKLGGLVSCWFNCTKLVCPLLIKPRCTCLPMSFPRAPHGESDPFRIKLFFLLLRGGVRKNGGV